MEVELDHWVGLSEVLAVCLTEVVIALNWVNALSLELHKHLLGDGVLVSLDIGQVVVPLVMRRNVSSPEDGIRLHFLIDVLVHQLVSYQGQITSVSSIWRCLHSRVFGVSAVVSAGHNLVRAGD